VTPINSSQEDRLQGVGDRLPSGGSRTSCHDGGAIRPSSHCGKKRTLPGKVPQF
jgi:hypothetical protein